MVIHNTAVAIGTEMSMRLCTNSTILVSGRKKNHNFFTFRPVFIIIKVKCFGLVRAMKYHPKRRNQHSYSLKPYLKLFELQSKLTSKALWISEILLSRPNTRLLLELFFSIDWRHLLWGAGTQCSRYCSYRRKMSVLPVEKMDESSFITISIYWGFEQRCGKVCACTHTPVCQHIVASHIYNKVV